MSIALALIDRASESDQRPILVVAGTSYGSHRLFLEGLIRRSLDFSTEIRPSTRVARAATSKGQPALVHDSKLTVNDPNPEARHRPILYDSGRPSGASAINCCYPALISF